MKRKIALFASAALALTVLGLAAAQGPAPKATGGVGFTWLGNDDIGYDARAEFNAHGAHGTRPDKGVVNVRIPGLDIAFKGSVSCYFQDGNVAAFSGPVTEGTEYGENLSIEYFGIAVQDNGTPGRNGDLITVEYGVAPLPCGPPLLPLWEVKTGNLVVH